MKRHEGLGWPHDTLKLVFAVKLQDCAPFEGPNAGDRWMIANHHGMTLRPWKDEQDFAEVMRICSAKGWGLQLDFDEKTGLWGAAVGNVGTVGVRTAHCRNRRIALTLAVFRLVRPRRAS